MKKLSIFCGALLIAAAMQAQIIHVPGDYPTIQQGIDAAIPGDTVLVDDGTYFEQINFHGKRPLMVASRYLVDGDENHIASTIIDGSQISDPDSASVVYFISGEDTTSILCGFTVQNGKGTNTLTGQLTTREGGGIHISGSGAKVIHNHITENHLNDTLPGAAEVITGAGLSCGWLNDVQHWVVIDHNNIDNNSCYSSSTEASGAGFGVCYNARIANNTVSGNTATGKLGCYSAAAGFYCGADWNWANTVTADVRNNLIINNTAEAQNNYASGAGASFQAVTGIFSDNEVTGNVSHTWTNSGGCGGMMVFAPRTGVVLRNNIFSENVSTLWAGGLALQPFAGDLDPASVLVENNYFLNNEAAKGGAFSTINTPVLLQNNVFSGNHATEKGGAIYLWKSYTTSKHHLATLINNSFYNNTAGIYGGAIYSQAAKPLIFNSVFYSDSAQNNLQEIYLSTVADTVEIAFSVIDTSLVTHGTYIGGGGIINADPMFEDLSLLTISDISPCYNTGVAFFTCECGDTHLGPAYDIEEIPRPWYGTFDMGAHEFRAPEGIRDRITPVSGLLCRNHPNPFNTSTTFTYTLLQPCQVSLSVFNSFGQKVAEPVNGYRQRGEQKVVWNAEDLPAGMYYYRVQAGKLTGAGKLVITK